MKPIRFALLSLLALAAPLTAQADASAGDACATRVALLENRLGALQHRLGSLEHELATRPRLEGAPRADWRDIKTWSALRVGMSHADVLLILGAPGRITSYYAFQRWEYPDALGARVNFDDRGRLIGWGSTGF